MPYLGNRLLAVFLLVTAVAGCGGGGGNAPVSDVVVSGVPSSSAIASDTGTTFTSTVANNGPDPAREVKITSVVGAGLVRGTTTCAAQGGATCPTVLGASMTAASIPKDGALVFTVNATATAGASGPTSHTLTAETSTDATPANNSASTAASVYTADVAVSVVPPAAPVPSGANALFTVTLSNAGPDTARDVTLTSAVGAGLTLVMPTCTATGGASCPMVLGAVVAVPLLPKGATLVFAVPATVVAGTNGPVAYTASAATAGDPASGNDVASTSATSYSANVGVSNTGPMRVAAGSTATFTATVANVGPGDARDLTILHTLASGYAAGSITCAASAGATCPAALGSSTTVPLLPAGASLTLTIPVATGATQRGALTSQLTLTSAGDPVASNNSSTATTVQDSRNGTYAAYAADGRQYTLAVDFDAATQTMSGNGLNASGAFTTEAGTGWYVVSGNTRFRTGEDLVVGGYDFGTGVQPFVAARKFVTTVAGLAGTYSMFSRLLLADGSKESAIGALRFSGSSYQTCNDNVVYTIDLCPASSLEVDAVTVSGDVFTATLATGQFFTFRMGMSGSTRIFLRAGASSAGSLTFRIALPDSAAFGGGAFEGTTTSGLRERMTLTGTSYGVVRNTAANVSSTDTATLTAGPLNMRVGSRASDGANLFLMQADPLAIVIGARTGPAAGYMELTAR